MHSPDHSTKGTPSALGIPWIQWPLTAWTCVVSGSVSSPSRGAFHLSLTVLLHYRSRQLFSLGEWSPQLPTSLLVACGTQDASPLASTVLDGIVTLSDRSFQNVGVVDAGLLLVLQPHRMLVTPSGLGSSRFARHYYGNLMLISFRRATEMFQLAHDPPLCLCIQHRVSRHHSGGVTPLGVSGLIACRQLPLNVSPVAASFFGLSHQGIHLARIYACLPAMSAAVSPQRGAGQWK